MSTKDVIAANLRTLRKVRGLSQPELAAKVGISPRTIARLEAAQVADPSINHVRDLARALGVTVDLLSESALEPLTIAVPVKNQATSSTRPRGSRCCPSCSITIVCAGGRRCWLRFVKSTSNASARE